MSLLLVIFMPWLKNNMTKSNLWKETFILAYASGRRVHNNEGSMVIGERRLKLSWHHTGSSLRLWTLTVCSAFSVLFSSARIHCQKVQYFSKTEARVRNQIFEYMSLRETFLTQSIALSINHQMTKCVCIGELTLQYEAKTKSKDTWRKWSTLKL